MITGYITGDNSFAAISVDSVDVVCIAISDCPEGVDRDDQYISEYVGK